METTLTWQDICYHEPRCECKNWMYVTVPNYRVYFNAYHWLRERNYKLIKAEGIYKNGQFTGAYKFAFLCEFEFLLFSLRWL
jgi:hypothetical protein